MKLCIHCKQTPIINNWLCRPCKQEYDRAYYHKTKSKQLPKKLERSSQIIERNSKFIFDYLINNPCVDCGETDPIVLEFDHKDPPTKKFTIGNANRLGYSLDSLKEEILKCEVRCANCHRRKTAKQFNYYRYKLQVVL